MIKKILGVLLATVLVTMLSVLSLSVSAVDSVGYVNGIELGDNAAIETDPTTVELELDSEPQVITVKNIGNVVLELIQPTSQYFELGTLSQTKLAPDETATFTVDDIKDENAFERIEIKTNYGTSTFLQVTYLEVNDHDSDHAGDKFENDEMSTDASGSDVTDNNQVQTDTDNELVKTGVRNQIVLPVILICVAVVIIVLLAVTKKKK